MIEITFRLDGWQQADAFLGKVERALSDLSGAFGEVRDEVRHEIDDVFAKSASNRPYSWSPWRPATVEARATKVGMFGQYYKRPGGGSEIGVWTGQLKGVFKGEKAPGVTRIAPDSLEMGLRGRASERRFDIFVTGKGSGDWPRFAQAARPIYENLNLESDGTTNPIARGMRRWFQSELGLTESP